MQPTIADVAMEARVSAITVSRVLNSPDVVRPATRARVEAAIDKVGYVRNMLAGSLASASSRFIAVIVPSLSNIVFIEVINGLQSEFERQGYQILLANTGYDLDRECQLVRTFLGWSPSALVVTGLRHNDACQRILSECDSPIAEIMELGDAIDLNIGLDHPEAGRCMARYLLGKGHRNIVYVAAQVARDYRAGLRYDGHREVLEAAGLRAPLLDMGQLGQFETGAQALDRVLADYPDASAIHFANDDLAAGAMGEAGDLLQAIDEGAFHETDLRAELAELLQGLKPGRTNDEAITLFKSVGASLEDLAAAIEVWETLEDNQQRHRSPPSIV